MTTKFVYVIGTATGPLKIGIANDPRSRLASIQSGSYVKLLVQYFIAALPSDALRIERAAHKALSKHRLSGEWFNVSCETAKAAILKAARAVARARDELERQEVLAAAERERLEQERFAAERAAIILVDGVQLVQRVTEKEYLAEQRRIAWERDAPRREFVKRMAAGKRAKKEQRRKEDERLAEDAVKLQAFLSRR
jgi:predicted GIY-YIG superfamily endonuclease